MCPCDEEEGFTPFPCGHPCRHPTRASPRSILIGEPPPRTSASAAFSMTAFHQRKAYSTAAQVRDFNPLRESTVAGVNHDFGNTDIRSCRRLVLALVRFYAVLVRLLRLLRLCLRGGCAAPAVPMRRRTFMLLLQESFIQVLTPDWLQCAAIECHVQRQSNCQKLIHQRHYHAVIARLWR